MREGNGVGSWRTRLTSSIRPRTDLRHKRSCPEGPVFQTNFAFRDRVLRGRLVWPTILGSGEPAPALHLMTHHLNDIGWKVDRVGSDRWRKRDRRERRFGRRRFDQD